MAMNTAQLESISIIYFDLETGGFRRTDDILQIAARCKDREFSVYITPQQQISWKSSQVTGLTNIGNELYLYNKKVNTVNLKKALIAFEQFLSYSEKPNLLVAHNVTFDATRLIKAIIDNNLENTFRTIMGFSDTLTVFKKALPERKGPKMFKLSTLAHDLLECAVMENFHDATYDVKILQQLICSIDQEDALLQCSKKYEDYVLNEMKNREVQIYLKKLQPLKDIISKDLLEKMARQKITYNYLKNLYSARGEKAVVNYCSEKLESGKPRVTKIKKVLNKIVNHLQNHV